MNMRKLLKQAQEMQDKMQRELVDTFVDASVGGGMVTLKMNGHKQLVALKIEPDIIDPEDAGMIEDLIVAAYNEGGRKMDDTLREKLTSMAGEMPSIL
ncbi:MAG: YbaB/EbfC family nucleoid-associated protein [bacterium]|nr:YbaB/EbfC family nucleoid-associated protein [bacterium]